VGVVLDDFVQTDTDATMASVQSVDNSAKQTIFGYRCASIEKNSLSGAI
jgi:hypothetical protein